MTISTQDCKEFINSINTAINGSLDDNWKRTKKYKSGQLLLRDFENQYGRTLTIAQDHDSLFLYALTSDETNVSLLDLSTISDVEIKDEKGRKYIGHEVNKKEVCQFMAECVQADNTIVDQRAVKDAIIPSSWDIFDTWGNQFQRDDYIEHPLRNFFANHDGTWEEYDLFYPDEDGNKLEINKEDIIQVFWVGMHSYETTYRIYIFETFDHQLWLGCNNPD